MAGYDESEIEKLIDGKLPWTRVQEIMKDAKDPDRIEKWIAILQKRVPWKERILLPLTPCLSIVQKDKQRVVKCRCGQEFGDYRANWKLEALIYVRETESALREVYRGSEQPDPAWVQIREYSCPGCGVQLEVEAVPRPARMGEVLTDTVNALLGTKSSMIPLPLALEWTSAHAAPLRRLKEGEAMFWSLLEHMETEEIPQE